MPSTLTASQRPAEHTKPEEEFRIFLRGLLIVVAVILALPTIIGLAGGPSAGVYLGEPYNTDDHMVYAAWMHQAEHGHLLMDNRFAVDSQPGLTVNVYFFLVGQVARLVGIPIASNLARICFGVLFAYLLYRFVRRFDTSVFACKLAVALGMVGGGLGFLVWHDFGRDLVLDRSLWMKSMTLDKLPTDVWQPEGFVFPSLLTNGLFAVSLCLILITLTSILDARKAGWEPVVIGAVSLGLLMNIHSYDVLLIGLISAGLLVAALGSKQASWPWVGRVLLITLGIIPGALWFLNVLHNDPVFAARAATPTFAANFRAMVFGYLPLLAFGTWGILLRGGRSHNKQRYILGLILFTGVFVMLMFSASKEEGFALTGLTWGALFVVTLASIFLLADEDLTYNLILSWALLGLLAPYFPGLFQRKLAMGLELPWALLSAFALNDLVQERHRGTRNLSTALVLLLLGGTGIRWLLRETLLIRSDVSETTVQPVYLKPQIQGIVSYLDKVSDKRTVVLCVPGVPNAAIDGAGNVIPDQYLSPDIPDLNPILSGLAGVYTYAGHWSETPDYGVRRNRLLRELFSNNATDAERIAVLKDTDANYIVAPVPEAFPSHTGPSWADLSHLGRIVVAGSNFELIEIKPPQ